MIISLQVVTVAFIPLVGTVMYTVTGTDVNTCTNTAAISVTVNPLPVVTASSTPLSPLCEGDNLTLNGGGATYYTWDNGELDKIEINPQFEAGLFNPKDQ